MTLPQIHVSPGFADTAALARARARARKGVGFHSAGFLHRIAKYDLQDRLSQINKDFSTPALITPFPEFWADMIPNLTVVAPDDTLALQAQAHDLVIHAMALHWAADPVGQIVQCRRALKPDGVFLAALFGGDTLTELRQALSAVEVAVMGGISPRIAPMGELRDMGSLLQRAGLALPVVDRVVQTVTYSDAFALMHDVRAMGEINVLSHRHRRIPPRRFFANAADVYAKNFPAADDPTRIRATFEIIFLAGWAPHESQQKPLRPGSAITPLAQVLSRAEANQTPAPVSNTGLTHKAQP